MFALLLIVLGAVLLASPIAWVISQIPRKIRAILGGILGAALLGFGVLALRPPLRFQETIRELFLVSPGQIVLVILAIFFGLSLYWWMTGDQAGDQEMPCGRIKGKGNNPPKGWLTGLKEWIASSKGWCFFALMVLVVVAALEPCLPGLIQRVIGVKTPWFEAQLRTAEQAVKQREVEYYGEPPLIRYEVLKEMIERGQAIAEIKVLNFEAKLRLEAEDQKRKKLEKEIETLKEKVKSIKIFSQMLIESGLGNFLKNSEEWMKEGKDQEIIKAQARCWVEILDKLVVQRKFDPKYKDSNRKGIQKEIVNNAPKAVYFHIARASLSWFAGNQLMGRSVLQTALENFREDFERQPVHSLLGHVITWSRDQAVKEVIEEGIAHYEDALQLVQALRDQKSRACEETDIKEEVKRKLASYKEKHKENKELKTTLEDLELGLKNNLAYGYARIKTCERRARDYAKDLKEAMRDDPKRRKASWRDTIGYVKFRFWKDSSELREAILIFEDIENEYFQQFEKAKKGPLKLKEREEALTLKEKEEALKLKEREKALIYLEIIRAHKTQAQSVLF